MPLAALTPVLNDLLHKGGSGSSSAQQNQSLQQQPVANDTSNTNEYVSRGSLLGQSTNATNLLSLPTMGDVSIE